MNYLTGDLITANTDPDFNALVVDINEVFGDDHSGSTTESVANFGYGQTVNPAAAIVAPGDIVTAAEWTAFFDTLVQCANHQGTANGEVPVSVAIGEIIDAFDATAPTSLLTVLTNVITNRLTINPINATITTSGTKDTSQRTTAWSTDIIHELTVTFTTFDAARHFFNTGGQIHFSGSRSGGTANTTNTNWTNIFTDMGTVVFDHTVTSAPAGTTTAIGFYNLTNAYQTIFTKSVAGYAGDQYLLEAKTDNAFGTDGVIRFRATLSTSGTADGTLDSHIDEQRSTGQFTITSPTFATVTEVSV